jgi:CheY-like chemotaxis protein
VLLVDDSKMIQKASTRALQREGFRVSNAYNGVECLKLLRDAKETGDGFSVVLLDMHMPVLDGLETVRRIRLEEEKEKGRAAKCGCEGVTYTVTSHTGISIGEDSVRVFPTSREVCCSDNRQYVIGLSANSDQESIDNAATAGMDNFICKPLKVSELREFCAAQIDL